MPQRPPELDFSTDPGRVASPKRMNDMADHILGRFRALEGQRPEWNAAIEQLKAIGLTRVTEVLQPIFDTAVAIGAELEALRDEQTSTAWRDQLVADVVASIVDQGLFVRCGAGAEGLTLYSGADLPPGGEGNPGDLYAFVETP